MHHVTPWGTLATFSLQEDEVRNHQPIKAEQHIRSTFAIVQPSNEPRHSSIGLRSRSPRFLSFGLLNELTFFPPPEDLERTTLTRTFF